MNTKESGFLSENIWLKDIKLVKERHSLAIYRQLADSILDSIADATIQKNDILPSINQLSAYLDVSRNTIEKAYHILKKSGYVESRRGKAYYIHSTDPALNQALLGSTDDLSSLFVSIYNLPEDKLIAVERFIVKLSIERKINSKKVSIGV
ncbi:GntR family transcriptional regulator [Dyadobacter sp. CY347]|uniref:GntR family transcriptional regulator n=1 Tax=Dyadobacter sp. CY347 TaxID=2909336 RepID=UPI001F483668|nr:winged helix-turn-helix domain-containing protein [Dyadobacter sp. CY347]MCF2491637.1 winged helix-turn-helix domain-containing protein [Dyadobacter sp. CY347]